MREFQICIGILEDPDSGIRQDIATNAPIRILCGDRAGSQQIANGHAAAERNSLCKRRALLGVSCRVGGNRDHQ